MKLRQFAKRLDAKALSFARAGDMKKSFAAMEVAAFIRRQTKEFQNITIPLEFFDDDK